MTKLLVAAALIGLAAIPAAAQDVAGTYGVTGTNFDGTAYSGTVLITPTGEDTCTIEWNIGGGISTGICMRRGAVFSAAYQLGDGVGLAVYDVLVDGTLEGSWTIVGADGKGTERFVPKR